MCFNSRLKVSVIKYSLYAILYANCIYIYDCYNCVCFSKTYTRTMALGFILRHVFHSSPVTVGAAYVDVNDADAR